MIYISSEQAFLEVQKDGSFPSKVYCVIAEFNGAERIVGYTPDIYAASQVEVEPWELRIVRPITKE